MNKDYLITKSNHFIMNSSYDLNLEEQKIILTLTSTIQPGDKEFKPYILKNVSPLNPYTSGETYYLYISKNVTSKDKIPLVSQLRYEFTVK